MTIIWGPESKIKEIDRINKPLKTPEGENKWLPTKALKITFKGPLPSKVAIGHTSYQVFQYTFPIPKCFKCLMYGHGIISCKNRARCSNCNQLDHRFKDCKNSSYCFFCNGNHPAYDRSCPIHTKAQEINKHNITPNNQEVKKLTQTKSHNTKNRENIPQKH